MREVFAESGTLKAETEEVEFAPTMRPVGQAAKTAASHAANVGSIPARVTTPFFLKEKGSKENSDRVQSSEAKSKLSEANLIWRGGARERRGAFCGSGKRNGVSFATTTRL